MLSLVANKLKSAPNDDRLPLVLGLRTSSEPKYLAMLADYTRGLVKSD